MNQDWGGGGRAWKIGAIERGRGLNCRFTRFKEDFYLKQTIVYNIDLVFHLRYLSFYK